MYVWGNVLRHYFILYSSHFPITSCVCALCCTPCLLLVCFGLQLNRYIFCHSVPSSHRRSPKIIRRDSFLKSWQTSRSFICTLTFISRDKSSLSSVKILIIISLFLRTLCSFQIYVSDFFNFKQLFQMSSLLFCFAVNYMQLRWIHEEGAGIYE